MSMNDIISAPLPASTGLNGLLAEFAAWRRRRAAYRNTMNELNKMSDHELADLRMSRADFHYYASTAAAKA